MSVVGPRRLWLTAPALALALAAPAAGDNRWDFPLLRERAQALYQVDSRARGRLDAWQALIEAHGQNPVRSQLDEVNRFFNRQLRFEDDQWIWGQADYWATPIESLVQGAADCEDYAIAKYVTLKQLGVPPSQLRLVYVKATERGESHMVLAWYASPGADPLILDNLIDELRPATDRPDLVPVYSFNATGLWLAGTRADRRVGSSHHLPRWQDVQNKMRNEGFPIAGALEQGD